MTKIKDIMTNKLETVEPNISLRKVQEKFRESGCTHLIVTDSLGTYKGILSKVDVLARINLLMSSTSGKKYTELELDGIQAHELMTTTTVNVGEDDSVEYATEILLQRKFHALPVVKNFKAVGIVTQHDLLKSYYEATSFTKTINYE